MTGYNVLFQNCFLSGGKTTSSPAQKTNLCAYQGIFSKYPTSTPVLYIWECPGGFNWIQPLVSCVTSGILNRLKPRTQEFHHIAVSRGPKRVISCRYRVNPRGHPCQKQRAIVQHLTKSPLRTRIYFVRAGMYWDLSAQISLSGEYRSRKQDEIGKFGRHFFRSYMRTSEKTIYFRGNLSSPGLKTVLKIKRYALRLSLSICMGDGGIY